MTVPADGCAGGTAARADLLVTEEPLGIRVNGSALAMTKHLDVEITPHRPG